MNKSQRRPDPGGVSIGLNDGEKDGFRAQCPQPILKSSIGRLAEFAPP
jgi:hypothetical protein